MTRFCAVLVLSGLLLMAGVTLAGAQAPVTVQTSGGEVSIIADHLEQVGPDGLVVATGNVEIIRGSSRLTADRVEVNRGTGDTVAVGRAILYDGEDRITGERIDYNVNSGTGIVYDGEARSAPYYRIGGQRLERIGENKYGIRRGVFTTCEDDPPSWSFRFGSGEADMETGIWGVNASLWVKDLPLIPFIPFFASALRRERQTGFLFPRFGSTTRKGYFYEQPFYWAISDSQDLTFTFDVYEKRGVGGNLEYRYILSERARGAFDGFFVKETEVKLPEKGHDDNRGWFGFKHEWAVAPGLSFKADINGVTDDLVLREYGDRLHERSAQRIESNVFVTKSWPQWNLVGNLFTYQDLTTDRPVELKRLPDIRFSGSSHPFPELRGFIYTLDSGFVNFVREVGSSGVRADARQRISQPFTPGGYFTITPFLATRLTAYDKTVTGTRITRNGGISVEETREDARLRPVFEVGSDFEARASRIYALDGFFNLDAVLHSIEPRVNYTLIDGTHFDKLPQWTEVDAVQRASVLTYSLINRLRARTVSPVGTEPVRWDLARFTLSQTYNLMELNAGQNFSPVVAELLVEPKLDVVRFRADTAFSPYTKDFQTANIDLSYTLPPFATAAIGYSWATPTINFMRWGLDVELNRYLVAHAQANWDLTTDTFVENRLGLDIRFQCWAFSMEFIRRANAEDEIRFALNLLGMGTLGTTAGVGAVTGTTGAGGAVSGVR